DRNSARAQSLPAAQAARDHSLFRGLLASRTNLQDKVRGDRAMSKNCERKPQIQPAFRFRMQARFRRLVFCRTKLLQVVLPLPRPRSARARRWQDRESTEG